MPDLVEIPVACQESAAAVDEVSPRVSQGAVRIPMAAAPSVGQWIRFRFVLADHTPFWEGVGRCAEGKPHAGGGFETTLADLSFDPRNEAMYERMLLVAEDAAGSNAVPTPVPTVPPSVRSSLLPSIPGARLPREAKRYGMARPIAPIERRPPSKLADVLAAPLRPKPSSIPPPPSAPRRPFTRSGRRAALEQEGHQLTVPDAHWTAATRLVNKLNIGAPSLTRGRWNEERVLRAALRMGLKSLQGLVEKE